MRIFEFRRAVDDIIGLSHRLKKTREAVKMFKKLVLVIVSSLIFSASVLSFIGLFIWIWRVSSRLSLLELKREQESTATSGIAPQVVDAPVAPTAPAGGRAVH